jgi:hypothetical protein
MILRTAMRALLLSEFDFAPKKFQRRKMPGLPILKQTVHNFMNRNEQK